MKKNSTIIKTIAYASIVLGIVAVHFAYDQERQLSHQERELMKPIDLAKKPQALGTICLPLHGMTRFAV